MVTLSLFRHAKSSWSNPGLRDFERPLGPRGEKAAPRMGAYMAREGLLPDLVLCSPAVRARQTLERAFEDLEASPEIRYLEALYHAGPTEMLKHLREVPERFRHAMLVGHNPGMHTLALHLIGAGDPAAIEDLSRKFPTAALAQIEFGCAWPEIGAGLGRLTHYMVPKRLPAERNPAT